MTPEAIGQSAPDWWTWLAANSEAIRNYVLSIGAVVGLVLLWSRTRSLRRQADTAEQRHEGQADADRERRITDSFIRAVEQLGSDKLETRLGAIYALERIAQESRRDHWPIMETLTAFVRERAPWAPEKGEQAVDPDQSGVKPATDVQAALIVIGRRRREHDVGRLPLELSGTDLRGARLMRCHLERAVLWGSHLERTLLGSTTHLEEALLWDAHLEGAFLKDAHLEGAELNRAHLKGARMIGVHLESADLTASDITQEQLDQAFTDENTKVPPGLSTKAVPSKQQVGDQARKQAGEEA